MDFTILGPITAVEVIARGAGVRATRRLRKFHGAGRWRKIKGVARVKLLDGTIRTAELHWHEAHGIDKKEIKIKRLLGPPD